MSLLMRARAAARVPAVIAPLRQSRRGLGESTRGPQFTDFGANLTIAKSFFTKSASSYAEFKQQCNSLRIFVFAGVVGYYSLALFLDPPKSSYWARWGPSYYPTHIMDLFGPSYYPTHIM